MLRNWLRTAWGDLARSPAQSVIKIGGLAIGLTAVILAGTVIANQMRFDDFLPLHDRLYLATVEATVGGTTGYIPFTPHDLAARFKQDFPEVEAVTRFRSVAHSLRRGDIEAREAIYSADPNFFRLLHFPVLYGNLATALDAPDSIVIPLAIARKYFGRDDAVGGTLELDRQHPLKVTAVIADLPENATNFRSSIFLAGSPTGEADLPTGIFMSGLASYSDLAQQDKLPANARNGSFTLSLQTVLLLRPGTSISAMQSRVLSQNDSLLPRPPEISATLRLIRLDALHLSRDFSPGTAERLEVLGVVALLTLFLAIINFVNISTARAPRRGLEVGIRKVAGASRGALALQFLGESALQVLIALCVAVALVEWLLPGVNAFVEAGGTFEYWREPTVMAALLCGAVVVGVLGGAYPAFLISRFRPVAALKGLVAAPRHADILQRLLVTAQFAVLVILAIASGVVLAQYRFAVRQRMHLDTDQVVVVRLPKCEGGFKNLVASLPGVRDVACSNIFFTEFGGFALIKQRDGSTVSADLVSTGPGLFNLYGQRPVAGRDFRQTDIVNNADVHSQSAFNVIINRSAAEKLGFRDPRGALGHVFHMVNMTAPGIVVGVVPDFSIFALEKQIDPAIYYFRNFPVRPNAPPNDLLHVKLRGQAVPETLAAIDAAWNRTGASGPIQRTFMDAYVENLHVGLLREGQAFTVFVGIAVLLSCLGLFGLSLFAVERRTKEIGVRKAMGATTPEIVMLLLWQFSRPVLWANVIAWPLAWWAMNRWLAGFAYHVSLPLWLFPAAGAVTLMIALLTVVGQAILTARQRPVLALRYE